MSNIINQAELMRHLDRMDGRAKGDSSLYRHLMSKDEDGQVVERSYLVQSGYNKIINELDPLHHQYVTLALFNHKDKRRKTTIKAASGLYVDLDDSLFGGKIGLDLIHYSLEQARIGEPSLTIHSGAGWHLYWLFDDLYYFNNDEDIKKYERTIESIIDSLTLIGADSKAKGSNRLLRLAGTYNTKYDSSPAVRVVESRDVYYNIDDFDGIRVVKKLLKSYDSPVKGASKSILTGDEPAANTASSKQSRVKKEVKKLLTRPDEGFPMDLIPEIIVDSQIELERRNKSARYMEEVNRSIIEDLLLNYMSLPRNRFVFDDGTVGQYIQEGNRNHFLWALARRGVSDNHLSIINRTLLLPSLGHTEFINVLKVGRGLRIPKISSIINDLGLSLAEQSVMMTLRLDYEKILDNHEKTIETRIDQVITEGQIQYILANPNKTSKELSAETGLSVRRVNQVIKQNGGGEPVMTREERIQELSNIRRDITRTGRVAIEELLADYQLAEEVLDRIIKNQTLIYNLRVPLTPEQLEEIKERAESLASKVAFITSQIEAYEAYIVDESEFFKSGKIKKSVLLDKLTVLKESTGRLVTV